MSQNPDEIRAEIDQTRNDLSRNVDALGEAVQPGNVAKRQMDKVTGRAADLKDRVMGAAPSAPSFSGSSQGPGMGDRVSDAASTFGDQAQQAGYEAKRRAEGNPLAVGLIALGAGWLVGSLLPASDRERAAVREGMDRAQPMMDEAKAKAQEVAGNLQEPAQQAFAQVKETAQGAVENVKAEGADQAQQVRESAQDSAQNVKASAQDSAQTVRDDAKGSVDEVRRNG